MVVDGRKEGRKVGRSNEMRGWIDGRGGDEMGWDGTR